ncbi:MAG TPA: N-acetylmuramoyl-L-alanine amidase, partial [Candidatus Polarisedimenticolaceae bacterium]|nr:N-acetylmuramoyl-L-alanine amidase [Candidatus Polarisedimenticolaceae bacterium]
LLALALSGGLAARTTEPSAETGVALLSSELRLRASQGRTIDLEVRARDDDSWATLARRITGRAERAEELRAGRSGTPSQAGWIAVPLQQLGDDYRALVCLRAFPEDRRQGGDWLHVSRPASLSLYDEGLWQVAEWFTGDGANFKRLMEANGLASPELTSGQQIRIPAELLHPALRQRPASDDGALEYGQDAEGAYAGYRLQAGEAVYSAVVVRFTGRTSGEDVRALADAVCRRSGIADPRDIPIGFLVKVPLDELEPDFLPHDHPRRLEAESARQELARELARQPVGKSRGLGGVLVILDPGHGGRDLGTINNGIWEHDYVYDVACRLKQRLERESSAQVRLTLEDRETGWTPSASDKLLANHQGTILTDPPFLAKREGEAQIGVNLRWYLANSVLRGAVRAGTDADRIVFLSLHADSRHPSLRGAMIYVPGAAYRSKTYGHDGADYARYREVQEKPTIGFSSKERIRSEAVSTRLAETMVRALRRAELPVQDYRPIRNRVIRGRSSWLPAVLRGNAVPHKLLIEMVNLSNPRDAALLASARDRDRLAEALFAALVQYFGDEPASRTALTHRAGGS